MKVCQIEYWKKYCSDSLDLIENYQQAEADGFKGWCIHHRLEIQQDKRVSRQELKDKGLYFNRPASELVFMRLCKHAKLHMIGLHLSAETRKKMSEAAKGKNAGKIPWIKGKHHSAETRKKLSEASKGRHHSAETRKKMSEAHKGKQFSEEHRKNLSESLSGEKHPMYGKHLSAETSKKLSQSLKGKQLGVHWWNDGVSCKHSRECPGEGWKRGRLKYRS